MLHGKKCRAQKFEVRSFLLPWQITAREYVWYFRDYFVNFKLHMYKNSNVLASRLILSIPDIVLSAPMLWVTLMHESR